MVLLDECRIAKVIQQDHAIFLELEMCRYRRHNGQPVLARAKWFSSYHGAEFGDWWVPEPGQIVLAFFPNGDSSNGIAFAVAPTKGDPDLPKGHGDDTSDEDGDRKPEKGRRVHRGRPGEKLDILRQGDVRARIDGNLEETVTGNRDAKTQGDSTLRVEGDHEETFEGEFEKSVEGDATYSFEGDRETSVEGDETAEVGGDIEITIKGETSETREGEVEWTFQAKFTGSFQDAVEWAASAGFKVESGGTALELDGATAKLSGLLVQLGGDGALRLIDERLYDWIASHTHSGGGSGTPNDVPLPNEILTQFTRAS